MSIPLLERDSVIKQTAQNMIEAGIVKPEEYEFYTQLLEALDPKDLLAALVESHMFRESESKRIKFYPIDIDAISMN